MKPFFLLSLLLLLVACGSHTTYENYELQRNGVPPPPPPAPMNKTVGYLADEEAPLPTPPPGDQYQQLPENGFINTTTEAVSTFSIDADGASYANVRDMLNEGYVQPEAVRAEEFINYFDLDYPYTDTEHPINLNGEVSDCPWAAEHKLVRVGIQGKPLATTERPAANFVFLIDVSGSMGGEDRLPLLQAGFKLFADELSATDRVAIVTYAGSAGVVLEATSGDQKEKIKAAIDRLGAGGGTAGAQGIVTAYDILEKNFIPGGNNRVVVGTDGDFNVGPSSHEELLKLIEEKREANIFLTVLGVGRGNYNDHMLEQLANKGNGTAEYIDNLQQLRKVFIYDYNKFYTVAKDVKVQVEFNPDHVKSYRLIGYENRLLATEDFVDDTKDAGEIGAGQNITALYEVIPHRQNSGQTPAFTIDFRYKTPEAIVSRPMQLQVFDAGHAFAEATPQHQFVGGVAAFAMLLRQSEYAGTTTYNKVQEWLAASGATDDHGLKQELYQLVGHAAAKK